MNVFPPAIFLMGPTAAGKTDLAVQLVEILPCEIISVDSAMVYRGMDIGTAKPDAATLERAPHRLIDIRDPAEPYSAADFRQDALRAMAEISAAGRIPLLVGGTMLYFKALIRGLADLPSADSAIRRRLEAEIAEHGLPRLHARLQEVDPAAAARIHPNDPQRLQRALEVFELTGRRLSELQAAHPEPLPYHLHQLAIVPQDRHELRRRISRRFNAMLEQGLVAEVEKLYQRGDLHPDLPALRAVGYRQVWRYLAGDVPYSAMIEQGITATCQFAKRQLTWLRSMPDVLWHAAEDPDLGRHVLKTLPEGVISRLR